jgi:BMFP domain-containing protein YqiC
VMEMKSFRKLVQWIREEFEATPDLRLTTREAAAFLGLDLATCEARPRAASARGVSFAGA